ncbi:FdrA family protein [Nocardioides terrisoli]|uniref:FdrA family protein n=1 Tax=Nocardioides terrisoli TaxID=3388267 RepID=UPI00287BB20F|nr:FdrA family protein [Nocardioides marmorisolisilvae]
MTSPTDHVEIRPGAYADSVTLLQVSRDVAATPGVVAAQVAMATPLNVEVLGSMGFAVPDCSPNDLVVALRLADPDGLEAARGAVDAALAAARAGRADRSTAVAPPRTTRTSLPASGTQAVLALVSVPGAHAFVEAIDALDAGCDVMVFSDNVSLEQEVALKQVAVDRGLLVMGPDCGTAAIGGVGLGFANTVRPGPVGIVAASGTGCQQVMCLLEAAGVGVGAALGVGGRDLSTEVGAISTRTALLRLDSDPAIERVLVVSKPPAPEVATALEEYAASLATPIDLALLGPGQPDLTSAVEGLLGRLGVPVPSWPSCGHPATETAGSLLRGLFVGGTLCDEAMLIATEALGPIRSNIPLEPELALDASLTADGHLMVDFGDDSLTRGRAHPMIDPTVRLDHLARAAADPRTGVVLLDVVLGHGAEADPAAALAPAIAACGPPVVVACVGTESDPQVLSRQAAALAAAGAEVHLSNAAAVRRAVAILGGRR